MTGRSGDDAFRDDEIELHDEDEGEQQHELAVNGRESVQISSMEEDVEFNEFIAPEDTVSVANGHGEDGLPPQQNGDVPDSREPSVRAAGSIDDGGSIPDDTPSVQVRGLVFFCTLSYGC